MGKIDRQIYSALRRKKVKQAVFLTPTGGFKMVKDPGKVKYYDEYEYIGSWKPKTDLVTISKHVENN